MAPVATSHETVFPPPSPTAGTGLPGPRYQSSDFRIVVLDRETITGLRHRFGSQLPSHRPVLRSPMSVSGSGPPGRVVRPVGSGETQNPAGPIELGLRRRPSAPETGQRTLPLGAGTHGNACGAGIERFLSLSTIYSHPDRIQTRLPGEDPAGVPEILSAGLDRRMNRTAFPDPICLVANGELPDHPAVLELLRSAGTLLAVDGGADHLREMGLVPDVLLGDLDSVKSLPAGIQVVELPDPNATDLEKALCWCEQQGDPFPPSAGYFREAGGSCPGQSPVTDSLFPPDPTAGIFPPLSHRTAIREPPAALPTRPAHLLSGPGGKGLTHDPGTGVRAEG
ncbi:MAG: hypothetical protein D6762_02760 [Candidatus Neomarinimicrobiota bacterium]|nr:MAG: hypothetical protein D6762_02760 [Candidatus Neomarinimicrobiota bacterium]